MNKNKINYHVNLNCKLIKGYTNCACIDCEIDFYDSYAEWAEANGLAPKGS